MPIPISKVVNEGKFSNNYHEVVFNVWYQNDCPAITDLVNLIPEDERGIKAGVQSLHVWHQKEGWEERADALNGQLAIQTDQMAIQQRLEMFKKHAELGRTLAQKGKEFLEAHEFDTGAEAIRAIVEGTDLERKSLGYAEVYKKIINASDDELNEMLKKYLGDGKVLDVEVKEIDASKPESNS